MKPQGLMLLGTSILVILLFVGSFVLLSKRRSLSSWLQLIGSAAFIIVVLTHFVEALDLVRWMRWGLEESPGHYLDLGGAVVGLFLFPIGYLAHALAR